MKRAWIIALAAGMVWATVVSLHSALAADPLEVLAFYIVKDAKGDGPTRFIDTPSLPKLGYISAVTPDLAIKRLKQVKSDVAKQEDARRDKDGKLVLEPMTEVPVIILNLFPEDEVKFAELTSSAKRKRLLVMVNGVPLVAPWVNERVTTPNWQLSGSDGQKNEQLIRALNQLVPQ
ncbi:MAG: hypothetical protein JWO94_3979 [Verrucomicrobiaceae bacterium]|nr:hypothetical protein [Verrucomicrobiaceae bacterium]